MAFISFMTLQPSSSYPSLTALLAIEHELNHSLQVSNTPPPPSQLTDKANVKRIITVKLKGHQSRKSSEIPESQSHSNHMDRADEELSNNFNIPGIKCIDVAAVNPFQLQSHIPAKNSICHMVEQDAPKLTLHPQMTSQPQNCLKNTLSSKQVQLISLKQQLRSSKLQLSQLLSERDQIKSSRKHSIIEVVRQKYQKLIYFQAYRASIANLFELTKEGLQKDMPNCQSNGPSFISKSFKSPQSSQKLEQIAFPSTVTFLQTSLEVLKDEKMGAVRKRVKKSAQSDDEDIAFELQEKDKKLYRQTWINKFTQACQKSRIQGMRPIQTYHQLKPATKESILASQALKQYDVLCEIKSWSSDITQLVCLQTDNLKEQYLTFYRFSPTHQNRKAAIFSQFHQLHKLSKKLSNGSLGSSYCANTVLAGLEAPDNGIAIGHQSPEKYLSLAELTGSFELNNESVLKYLARTLCKLANMALIKTGHQFAILPQNIIFTTQLQLRLLNIAYNSVLNLEELRRVLHRDRLDYYFEPGHGGQTPASSSGWSIGVLLFELLFSKKPFSYQFRKLPEEDSRILFKSLVLPSKPTISDKLKDFLICCFERKPISQLIKHPYFR